MAGPNGEFVLYTKADNIVEVFKFGLYMFFPLWVMYKFGDPEWYVARAVFEQSLQNRYNDYVKPVRLGAQEVHCLRLMDSTERCFGQLTKRQM